MTKRATRTSGTPATLTFTNTLAGRAALANDGAWNATVAMGVLRSAGFVLAEGPVGAPELHAKRVSLGQAVINDPTAWGRRFAQVLASDPGITTDAPTDQMVLDTISAWWNHFAGADV